MNKRFKRLSVYEILINQRKPTIPITEDLEVGWRLALASKTMQDAGRFIMGWFIPVVLQFVKNEIEGWEDVVPVFTTTFFAKIDVVNRSEWTYSIYEC